jgi:hypothetical protein
MTREECERAILEKAAELAEIVKQYEPDNDYLNLCIIHGDRCCFNNRYWVSSKIIKAPYTKFEDKAKEDEQA